jgi:hypothetical protein
VLISYSILLYKSFLPAARPKLILALQDSPFLTACVEQLVHLKFEDKTLFLEFFLLADVAFPTLDARYLSPAHPQATASVVVGPGQL